MGGGDLIDELIGRNAERRHGAVELLRGEAYALDRSRPELAAALRDFAAHVEARGYAGWATPAGNA